jgi:hypothetical protein
LRRSIVLRKSGSILLRYGIAPEAANDTVERHLLEDKRDSRKRISRLKSSERPCAFGTDLLNDRVGREIGQEQGGDEQGTEDGFDAVQNNVSSDSDDGQNDSEQAFQWYLKQLCKPDDRRADCQGEQFRPDRDAAITKERVT